MPTGSTLFPIILSCFSTHRVVIVKCTYIALRGLVLYVSPARCTMPNCKTVRVRFCYIC